MVIEIIAKLQRDVQELKSSPIEKDAVLASFLFLTDSGNAVTTNLQGGSRVAGSSFILGHPQYGALGTGQSPQPYLGDSRGAMSTKTNLLEV